MTASLIRHTAPPKAKKKPLVVENNSGGPAYEVNKWNRLMRFLTIGTEAGTYYVNEKNHTLDNVKVLAECMATDINRYLDTIVDISQSGRAPRNDYALYALAVAAAHKSPVVARRALQQLPKVARTGRDFLKFVSVIDTMRGWGPVLREGLANWYIEKHPDDLAFQMVKYQSAEGWTHRDVLRKIHVQPKNQGQNAVFGYVTQGKIGRALPNIALYKEAIQRGEFGVDRIAQEIYDSRLPREIIPTELLNDPVIARALAATAPYTALMRNLGNYTRQGVFDDKSLRTQTVLRLVDTDYIRKSRVHPINVLTAARTYVQGQGFRGKHSWTPISALNYALNEAFYGAFPNVEPTGQRWLIGVDVSGSMGYRPGDSILTSSEIAGALAMTIVRTEPWCMVYGFDHGLKDLKINRNDTLEQVFQKTNGYNMGGTDCSLLIQFALDNRIPVENFVIITDNETNRGRRNPSDVLREYRRKMGINAKLIVLATDATRYSIADPNDPGMLDISGFDSSVPEIIGMFALGNI